MPGGPQHRQGGPWHPGGACGADHRDVGGYTGGWGGGSHTGQSAAGAADLAAEEEGGWDGAQAGAPDAAANSGTATDSAEPDPRAQAAADEVRRIIAAPDGEVLQGRGRDERRKEFLRLLLLLHPDKRWAPKGNDAARAWARVLAAGKCL